jgi:TRAP-type C4-dicarboxylate transport system permease small subunit
MISFHFIFSFLTYDTVMNDTSKQTITLYITLSIAVVALVVGVVGLLHHPANNQVQPSNNSSMPIQAPITNTPATSDGATSGMTGSQPR